MRGVLVDCPEHGFVEDAFFKLDESSEVGFYGMTGRCSRCGRPAPVLDGEYDESGGTLNARLILTKQQAHRLRQSLRWAQQQRIDRESDAEHVARVLERTIEENAPEVKPWLEKFRGPTSMAVAAWASFLLAVVTVLLTVYGGDDQGISGDQLEQILDRAWTEWQSQEGPAQPTPSTPSPPAPEESPALSGGPEPTTQ